MLMGALESRCIVLVGDHRTAIDMGELHPSKSLKFISYAGMLDRALYGIHEPMLLDNSAISAILSDALGEIQRLKKENVALRAKK